MEKIITYETLRNFAYSNDKLIKGKIRGIVLEFAGLGNTKMYDSDPADALEYAEQGVLFVIPYTHPWCWMNQIAVDLTDEVVSVLCEHYGLPDDVRIVSTGRSMGGLSSIVYCAYSKKTPVLCVANCPVCDLPYHFTERPDLPRTLYNAFATFDGTLEEALPTRSPLHLVDRLPKIPYAIFHCENDKSVNLKMHSERFVEAMKGTHTITLERVPLRGHCDLSSAAWVKYRKTILSAFEN